MTRLILLRHGESEANQARIFSGRLGDPTLTPEGRRQVEQQARALVARGIGHIFTSPKLRALQTAEIVGETLGLNPTCCESLLEVDVGSIDGRGWPDATAWESYDEVRQAWQRGDHDRSMPSGESLTDVEGRLRDFLNQQCSIQEGPILLVGHGILFMSLLWLFCDNRADTLQGNYMKGAHVTSLKAQGDRYMIRTFNVPPVVQA